MATFYFVFGQPHHLVVSSEMGEPQEGDEALAQLIHQLPPAFTIEPWRKELTRTKTLTCSLDELMEPFAELAGARSPSAVGNASAEARDDAEDGSVNAELPPFDLESFPLLPLGQTLWSDAAANVVHLDVLIPKLPPSIIVLTGDRLRAAALVNHGHIIDAVWVDNESKAVGETAAMALMGMREGTLSGYRIDSTDLPDALTLLWRGAVLHDNIRAGWLDPEPFLANLERHATDYAIRISGDNPAVAFVYNGKFIAIYTQNDRIPTSSREAVHAALANPSATITLLGHAPVGIGDHPETDDLFQPYPETEMRDEDTTSPEPAYTAAVLETPSPLYEPEHVDDGDALDSETAPLAPDTTETSPSASSSFDFESVQRELIAIAVQWLGDDSSAVRILIESMRPDIDDVLRTVERIKHITIPGHDATVIHSMATEMHHYAAEYLSGL